jgi:hypothetical protein
MITKFVVDKKTLYTKEKCITELNNKTTIIINNPRIDKVPVISFNNNDDETNPTTYDKNDRE